MSGNDPITGGYIQFSFSSGRNGRFSALSSLPVRYVHPDKVIFYYDGGQHVFDVNWAFGWNENSLWNRGAAYKYTSTFSRTSLQVNLEMSFASKIVEAFKFVESPSSNDAVVFQKIVDEIPVEVTLEYKDLDGQKRFVFASYGAFDSTKAYDYTDSKNYPNTAFVKFLGEDGWRTMELVWDLSIYSTRTDILQNGYSGKIGAMLALGQPLGDVYISVAASAPDEIYVVYEEEEGIPVLTDSKIRFNLLSIVGGKAVITDPRAIANFPQSLYFSYSPSKNLDSGWFDISEWVLTNAAGLNKIDQYYRDALAAGTPLQNIANPSIVVIAKFGNAVAGYIEIPIEVAVYASLMSEELLGGMPLANSSLSGGGSTQNSMIYSLVEDEPALTVNPYVANPRVSASYPTKLSFRLNSGDTVTMDISSWDLSAIPLTNLHNGTTGGNYYSVTALIDVGMDISAIKLPVRLYVTPRIIEKVWVDESIAKNIYIDPYSLQPFGENVEAGFAYKRVVAKFVNDDNTYTMVMKYDISNIILSYTGGAAAYGVTVYVGNEAGGYQAIPNYNIYIKQSLIVSISTDAEVSGIAIGELYSAEYNGGVLEETFKALNSLELSALLAQKYLTISFGTPTEVTSVRTISVYDGVLEGLVYQWKRDAEGVLYLELWNNNPLYAGILGDNQIIISGLTNYVEIDFNLFTMPLPEEGLEEIYSGKTAGAFLASWSITSDIFTDEQMGLKLVRVSDEYELTASDILNAGEYQYILTVTGHCEYGGSIIRTIIIQQKAVLAADFNIRAYNSVQSLNYSKYYDGIPVVLEAVTLISGLTLSIVYDGFSGNPVNAAVYNYAVVSNNPNYICAVTGSVTINAQVIDDSNSIITVGDTDALTPPTVSVIVAGRVLTISEYTVYYGSSSEPALITITNYATFIAGFEFGTEDSATAYAKIVIIINNYVITTIIRDFTISKAQA
ncbi:MAG: hypothetical protein EOM87_02590 [Clostridia bacterium]|nr:hypothetical protein [Clostridia bacterium]